MVKFLRLHGSFLTLAPQRRSGGRSPLGGLAPRTREGSAPSRPRVLVVDDERAVRSALSELLDAEGFSVATADTGERAVKIASREPFDLVLMDVRLPGIDGIEAARRLRRQRGEVPVIMMSAYALEAMEKRILSEGAVAFVRKPLNLQELSGLLEQVKSLAGVG